MCKAVAFPTSWHAEAFGIIPQPPGKRTHQSDVLLLVTLRNHFQPQNLNSLCLHHPYLNTITSQFLHDTIIFLLSYDTPRSSSLLSLHVIISCDDLRRSVSLRPLLAEAAADNSRYVCTRLQRLRISTLCCLIVHSLRLAVFSTLFLTIRRHAHPQRLHLNTIAKYQQLAITTETRRNIEPKRDLHQSRSGHGCKYAANGWAWSDGFPAAATITGFYSTSSGGIPEYCQQLADYLR